MAIHPGSPVLTYGKFTIIVVKDASTDEMIALWEATAFNPSETATVIEVPDTVNRRRTIPSIVTAYNPTLKFSVLAPNNKTRSLLFGEEAATAVAGHDITRWEYATIPSAPGPYTVTMTNAPQDDLLAVQIFAGSGKFINLYEVSAGSETSQQSYSRSGVTLTFASGDAGTNIRSAYLYAASGTDNLKSVWKLSDMPNIVKLVATVYGEDGISGEKTVTVYEIPRMQIISGRNYNIPGNEFEDAMEIVGEMLPRNDGTSASEEILTRIDSVVTAQP